MSSTSASGQPRRNPIDYVEGGWPDGTVKRLSANEGGELLRYQVDQLRLFVAELIAHRERRGLSKAKVAELAEIRPNTVGELENGLSWPDWSTISRIAFVLEADIRFVGRLAIRVDPVRPR